MERDWKRDMELCESATKGPWKAESWNVPTADQYTVGSEHDNSELFTAWQGTRYPGGPEVAGEQAKANAVFAAESRTALPYWLKAYAAEANEFCYWKGEAGKWRAEAKELNLRCAELEAEADRLRGAYQLQAIDAAEAVGRKERFENAIKDALSWIWNCEEANMLVVQRILGKALEESPEPTERNSAPSDKGGSIFTLPLLRRKRRP